MKHQPIPSAALDDRLGFVGTAGSGKTYGATGQEERILDAGGRIIHIDPLGVAWGLRLMADGAKPSPYRMVIFGGAHGDLPLTEHAGAIIGETVAGMQESCILDLSALGTKASERRFMLAFLTALYRNASKEPVHLVFDEADMWAPQRLLDKEGDAAKLLGQMETIVRRGRVKGFIPWLITQRPAVLSKDVLSQVDGLVAFKLTSSQDRDAIGDWVEGQADRKTWLQVWGSLPAMQRGHGLVWIPGRSVMDTEAGFPLKRTFDSSRTPKRGETMSATELQPIDIGALKERLATIEAEVAENDPRLLKAEIARLRRELAAAESAPAGSEELERLRVDNDGLATLLDDMERERDAARAELETEKAGADELRARLSEIGKLCGMVTPIPAPQAAQNGAGWRERRPADQPRQSRPAPPPRPASVGNGTPLPMTRKILDAIHGAYPVALTFPAAAARAGASRRSSQYRDYERQLRASEEVQESGGRFRSAPGFAQPVARGGDHIETWASRLPPSYANMLREIARARRPLNKEEIAERAKVSPTSSGLSAGLRELMDLALVETTADDRYALAEGI